MFKSLICKIDLIFCFNPLRYGVVITKFVGSEGIALCSQLIPVFSGYPDPGLKDPPEDLQNRKFKHVKI